MTTVTELQEEVAELRTLVQQAQERSMRHGQEHWIEGSDPAAIRWQVSGGAPTHEAEEGTPYWDSNNNVGYVNSDGGSTWEALAAGGGGGSAHNIISSTHSDTTGVPSALSQDLLTFVATGGGKWVPLAANLHGNHPTTTEIIAAVPYRGYQQF